LSNPRPGYHPKDCVWESNTFFNVFLKGEVLPRRHTTLETLEDDALRRGRAAPPGLSGGRLGGRSGRLGLWCHGELGLRLDRGARENILKANAFGEEEESLQLLPFIGTGIREDYATRDPRNAVANRRLTRVTKSFPGGEDHASRPRRESEVDTWSSSFNEPGDPRAKKKDFAVSPGQLAA